CGRQFEKRVERNGKPYFCCDPCGTQLFVRGQKGRDLLEEAFRSMDSAKVPFAIHSHNLYEIQAHLKEIAGVREEIEKLGISYFFSDEKMSIRNSLQTRLKNLLLEFKQMAGAVR